MTIPTEDRRLKSQNIVLYVVGFGALLTAMAASGVNLTLPSLSEDLGISIDLASWVLLSFLLCTTVLLLVAGRAGDLFGHRRIYLTGFLLFGLASLACGLVPTIWLLIGARILQGIGGSMVMATGPALLTTTFPGSQRGKALGSLASATYVGLAIGPPLGGFLITGLGWQWVFFINVPIAAVVFIVGAIFLPPDKKETAPSFDAAGAAALILGLPLLLLAVSRGQEWGWRSVNCLLCAAAGIALLAAFVLIESRSNSPLLNLDLFRSRLFIGSTLAALFNYVALFVQIILLPYYLIEALGLNAALSGLVLSAQPLVMAAVASPSGRLSDRIGSRWLAVAGMAILSLGLLGLSTVGQDSSGIVVAAWLGITGLGTGIFISPNSSALMGSAPKRLQGTAGGIMGVARNLGMMTGVALATIVFKAAGGTTGIAWRPDEFRAFSVSFYAAAGISLLAALVSAFRPESTDKG